MAADVTGESGALLPPQPGAGLVHEPGAPQPAAPRRHWPHRGRFLLVYGLLGVVLAAGIASAVVFGGRSINPGPAWSSWKPSGGGLGAARQIAEHVAPAYRLPGGKQIVDVIAKAPSVSPGAQVVPIHYLAVRGTGGAGDQTSDVSPSNSVMFSLCGLGQACSISSGTASVARGRLVRREILELALYTFKYVGGIQNVIAFMPPKPGAAPQYVVYLRRSDLGTQFGEPLAQSLAAKAPLPNTIPAREVRLVDATTESRVFSFSLSQAQQGDAILVLAPIAA